MNRDQFVGLLRHVLTFAGGFFVTKGFVDTDMLAELIGGLLSIIGVIWSIADKKTVVDTDKS
jgi:hypothetical protein